MLNTVRLIGLSTKLGPQRVPIRDIAERFGKGAEDVTGLCGVTALHFFRDTGEFERACVEVIVSLLLKTEVSFADIKHIYGATNGTGATQMPTLTALTSHRVGFRNTPVHQIGIGCSGISQAMQAAHNQLRIDAINGKISYCIVLLADRFSTLVDPRDYETNILFSDGAAAVMLTNNPEDKRGYAVEKVATTALVSDSACDALVVPTFYEKGTRPVLQMKGSSVYRFAVKDVLRHARGLLGLTMDDLHSLYFIPHQANLRIIKEMTEDFLFSPDNVYTDGIRTIGNTLNASIIFGLQDVLTRMLINPERVLGLSFGAEGQIGGFLLDDSTSEQPLVV